MMVSDSPLHCRLLISADNDGESPGSAGVDDIEIDGKGYECFVASNVETAVEIIKSVLRINLVL